MLQQRKVDSTITISFARIFFRNAVNLGLPVIECAEAGDNSELDQLVLEKDQVRNLTNGRTYPAVFF